jgi:putative phosphoribosyl transferase
MDQFNDRQEAGIFLAKCLKDYDNLPNVILLALPRGGVPVAFEIAKALSLPLDVFIVRKLGVPSHTELAMGAIASGDTVIVNQELVAQLGIEETSIERVLQAEQKELARRERLYRGNRPFPLLTGKTVILVDDGIATGATMQAAVASVKKYKPASIIIAVPVAAYETCIEIGNIVDKIICPLQAMHFYAVGLWYKNFLQVSDAEVIELLEQSYLIRKP